MYKNVFCTIITSSHIEYAKSLFKSIISYNQNIAFHVLLVDSKSDHQSDHKQLKYWRLSDIIEEDSIGQRIVKKYCHHDTMDQLRWSLKSVFIKFLLSRGCEKVIFTDPDTFYYKSADFIFEKLNDCCALLSPHFRSFSPDMDYENFNLNFIEGIYNGGFIGVSEGGSIFLDWWAKTCLYACEKDIKKGRYVDQKYLDLAPVCIDNVGVLRHKGCNVSNWNQVECKRLLVGDTVLINGKYPIIFIHFTKNTIENILIGKDALLRPYLNTYLATLKKYLPEEKLNEMIQISQHGTKNHLINWIRRVLRYKIVPILESI